MKTRKLYSDPHFNDHLAPLGKEYRNGQPSLLEVDENGANITSTSGDR